jgi:hemoglobin
MENTVEKSLYERLGKAEGISRIVDDIVEAHMVNPAIMSRFLPFKGTPELKVIKKHTCNFFGAGSGGNEEYTGRDMLTTHRGMNISEAEYMHTMDDILASLDKNNIDEQSRKDVLAIVYSLKDQIIKQ